MGGDFLHRSIVRDCDSKKVRLGIVCNQNCNKNKKRPEQISGRLDFTGAARGTRTLDPRITNALLYHWATAAHCAKFIITEASQNVNRHGLFTKRRVVFGLSGYPDFIGSGESGTLPKMRQDAISKGLLRPKLQATLQQKSAKKEIFEYIELFYNQRQLHNANTYAPPVSKIFAA